MAAAREPPQRSPAPVFLGKPHPAFRLCPVSGKRCYASRDCARRYYPKRTRVRLYVYWCRNCRGFHITRRRQVSI